MAEVIFTGPTPERPNPLLGVAEGLSAGGALFGNIAGLRAREAQGGVLAGVLDTTLAGGNPREALLNRIRQNPAALADPGFIDSLTRLLPTARPPAALQLTAGPNDERLLFNPNTGAIQVVEGLAKAPEPRTELARLRADLAGGLIDREDFIKARQDLLAGRRPSPDEARAEAQARAEGRIAGERAAGGAPRAEFLDASGALKSSVSGEIRRQVAPLVGGTYNPTTGTTTALSQEASAHANRLAAEVERILLAGDTRSVGQAVELARDRVGVPRFRAPFAEEIQRIVTASASPAPTTTADDPEARRQEAINTANATGIGAAIASLINNTVGQIVPAFVSEDVEAARQSLGLLQGDFIVAMNRNPKLPVWEQIRLSRIISDPSVWRGPESTRAALRELDRQLGAELGRLQDRVTAPTTAEVAKPDLIEAARDVARLRQRVRAFDAVPLASQPGTEGGVPFRILD